ncbi:hypothetical protein ACHQM5_005354 [Ranunculus cassubicifolius]
MDSPRKAEEVTNEEENQVTQQLPQEIISQILVKIPADILYRLRQVCHPWSDLILSKHFVNTHLLQSEPGILILERDNERDKFEAHFMDIETGQVIKRDLSFTCSQLVLGICNGLLFLGSLDVFLGFHDMRILNLATKKSLTLPAHPYPTSSTPFVMYFAESISCGLTYVPSTNEYKASISIFRMVESLGTGNVSKLCECRILTLGTNTWREIVFPLEGATTNMHFGSSISVGGVLHFRIATLDSKRVCHLMSLDMESEKLVKTNLPDEMQEPKFIVEIGGFLSLVDCDVTAGRWDIWGLKDYYRNEWVKTYSFCVERDIRFYGYGYQIKPTVSLKNGKVIVFVHSYMQSPICLYAYDVEKEEMKRLGNVETKRLNQYSPHVNSLASWEG